MRAKKLENTKITVLMWDNDLLRKKKILSISGVKCRDIHGAFISGWWRGKSHTRRAAL